MFVLQIWYIQFTAVSYDLVAPLNTNQRTRKVKIRDVRGFGDVRCVGIIVIVCIINILINYKRLEYIPQLLIETFWNGKITNHLWTFFVWTQSDAVVLKFYSRGRERMLICDGHSESQIDMVLRPSHFYNNSLQ